MAGLASFRLLCLVFFLHQTLTSRAPVKVRVFYETLCGDSMRFFRNQLKTTYDKHAGIIELDLHAYGKINEIGTGKSIKFNCQHGPAECAGNILLGCAKKYFQKGDTLKFTFCVMSSRNPPNAGDKCAREINDDSNYALVKKCASSDEGKEILRQEGVIQRQLAPNLFFVPWITINGEFSKNQLAASLRNLEDVVLRAQN